MEVRVLFDALAAAPASAVGYDDAGYLAYADRMQERLDRLWDERRGLYKPSEGGSDALINANLLLTHSVAAHAGHRGPARNDARARSIAEARPPSSGSRSRARGAATPSRRCAGREARLRT